MILEDNFNYEFKFSLIFNEEELLRGKRVDKKNVIIFNYMNLYWVSWKKIRSWKKFGYLGMNI